MGWRGDGAGMVHELAHELAQELAHELAHGLMTHITILAPWDIKLQKPLTILNI